MPTLGLRDIRSVMADQVKMPSCSSVRDHNDSHRRQRRDMWKSPRVCALRSAWPANPTGPLEHAGQGALGGSLSIIA